ncbi:MAG: cytochrome c3 family protein [Spirochaetota bacterium]|nr:cytochrome c3 family protein [Spirochaetota bacterium]
MKKDVKHSVSVFFIFALSIAIICIMPGYVQARVSGECVNCHTMHNSQGGDDVDGDGPYSSLLTTDCVGCHSSAVFTTYYDLGGCNVPVVLFTGGEPATYLAGGNFYWVKEGLGGDDTKGHNVFLGEDDDNLSEAPGGFPTGCVDSCHVNLSQPFPDPGFSYGDINGKYGCQGCHVNPRHHANDHDNGVSGLVDGGDMGWYRFLSAHQPDDFGVKGFEDGDWEAGHPNHLPGTSAHNEYRGDPASHYGIHASDRGDISGFCTGCHAYYSSAYAFDDIQGQKNSHGNWIRHPSDSVIPDDGEYADVGGVSHLYDPLSPVGKPSIDSTPDTTVTPGADMVMCISCHRPHGSPYADMLRWDYTEQVAGGGGLTDDQGCFYCHTLKNE